MTKERLVAQVEIREPVPWNQSTRGKAYLCQYSYIEKIAHKFGLDQEGRKWPSTPLPTMTFERSTDQATNKEIHDYQDNPKKLGAGQCICLCGRCPWDC